MPELEEQLRPRTLKPVQQLVQAAGINVDSWAKSRLGDEIEENKNVYKNFLWAFGGGADPIALCVWHREIDWTVHPPVRVGNMKQEQADLNALADRNTGAGVRRRIGIKVRRSLEFGRLIREAYLRRQPIRFILLEGKMTSGADAAVTSSEVYARELDDVSWYAHMADPFTGEFKIVRGVERPQQETTDPFDGLVDPAADPAFQDFLAGLESTEQDSLIKARVGQGAFREGLIKRWKGCSVTQCGAIDFLVASHIKPWSRCETVAERLGTANGLLLLPNLDRAFDRGFISFDDKFRILVSPTLASGHRTQLSIDHNKRLGSGAGPDLLPYLRWHRENVFRDS